MLLALAGGRIVVSDWVVFRMVRAGALSSRVGVTREALGRTLSVLVAGWLVFQGQYRLEQYQWWIHR